jgi:hypothetical protein
LSIGDRFCSMELLLAVDVIWLAINSARSIRECRRQQRQPARLVGNLPLAPTLGTRDGAPHRTRHLTIPINFTILDVGCASLPELRQIRRRVLTRSGPSVSGSFPPAQRSFPT